MYLARYLMTGCTQQSLKYALPVAQLSLKDRAFRLDQEHLNRLHEIETLNTSVPY